MPNSNERPVVERPSVATMNVRIGTSRVSSGILKWAASRGVIASSAALAINPSTTLMPTASAYERVRRSNRPRAWYSAAKRSRNTSRFPVEMLARPVIASAIVRSP